MISGPWHVLVMAKAPVPGRVKTRLCPPLQLEGAARVAEAALSDTLEAVAGSGAARRIIALDGEPGAWLPPGFEVIAQRGSSLNERLAAAWSDAGGPGVQIGMDTPQIDADLLDAALAATDSPGVTATLGPAEDGGWWAIGLAGGLVDDVFAGVPMSEPHTGAAQVASLRQLRHRVALLPTLRDVDTAADARAVAGLRPGGSFAAAWTDELALAQRRNADMSLTVRRVPRTVPVTLDRPSLRS